jgi:predicted NAD/FAD-dependent oxidoreductase
MMTNNYIVINNYTRTEVYEVQAKDRAEAEDITKIGDAGRPKKEHHHHNYITVVEMPPHWSSEKLNKPQVAILAQLYISDKLTTEQIAECEALLTKFTQKEGEEG